MLGALTPSPSPRERVRVRKYARSLASRGDWLSLALDHHRDIEAAFAATKDAAGTARIDGLTALAGLLMGHSIAEEAVLYPALAQHGEKARATIAYGEQALVKTQMDRLQQIDPDSEEFTEELEAIRLAVDSHVHQ